MVYAALDTRVPASVPPPPLGVVVVADDEACFALPGCLLGLLGRLPSASFFVSTASKQKAMMTGVGMVETRTRI